MSTEKCSGDKAASRGIFNFYKNDETDCDSRLSVPTKVVLTKFVLTKVDLTKVFLTKVFLTKVALRKFLADRCKLFGGNTTWIKRLIMQRSKAFAQ